MLKLYKTDSPGNDCITLKYLYPAVSTKVIPPWFAPYKGNYTCLSRKRGLSGGHDMGTLRGCGTTMAVPRNPYGITNDLVTDQEFARFPSFQQKKCTESSVTRIFRFIHVLIQILMSELMSFTLQ